MIKLETDRLLIEPMSLEELAKLVVIYNKIVPELSQAYQEMLHGCEQHYSNYLWYTSWKMCLRSDGQKVGDGGFKGPAQNGLVEIGYGINDSFQGQGYASEGAKALCTWALNQEGVRAVEAETAPDNRASMRVLQKIGFVATGKNGAEGPRFILFSHSHDRQSERS
ncbi:MAG: GNAT family N-acetyltransferase [Candidatus Bruticola sp.]